MTERTRSMDNIKDIVLDLRQDSNVSEVVSKWENRFEAEVRAAADHILQSGTTRTVALAGPSCSGKTTTAKKLAERLSAAGRRVVPVSIDDFYLDGNILADRVHTPDYESPDALDLAEFGSFTYAVMNGDPAYAPIFDFKERRRVGKRKYIPEENDIYIFEGIQAHYPEVYSTLSSAECKRVFINVSSAVTANGMKFESDEIRLLRRILRDYNNRASSPEFTLRLWESVRENEEKRIFPYGEASEIKINSVIPYDLYVMCTEIYDILDTVDLYSPLYPTVSFLKKKMTRIIPYSILESDVPADSLLHEFID